MFEASCNYYDNTLDNRVDIHIDSSRIVVKADGGDGVVCRVLVHVSGWIGTVSGTRTVMVVVTQRGRADGFVGGERLFEPEATLDRTEKRPIGRFGTACHWLASTRKYLACSSRRYTESTA